MSLDDFAPPQKPPPVPEWATYAPHRRPQWKVYKRLSDAKNAFYAQPEIALYQFDHATKEWVERYRQTGNGSDHCDECGVDLRKTYGSSRVYLTGRRIWDPRSDELKRIRVCYECDRKIRRY